jgi:hypothetical protein
LVNTSSWIGTTECAALLRYFGLRAVIVDFDKSMMNAEARFGTGTGNGSSSSYPRYVIVIKPTISIRHTPIKSTISMLLTPIKPTIYL